jgi:hypothetical protein
VFSLDSNSVFQICGLQIIRPHLDSNHRAAAVLKMYCTERTLTSFPYQYAAHVCTVLVYLGLNHVPAKTPSFAQASAEHDGVVSAASGGNVAINPSVTVCSLFLSANSPSCDATFTVPTASSAGVTDYLKVRGMLSIILPRKKEVLAYPCSPEGSVPTRPGSTRSLQGQRTGKPAVCCLDHPGHSTKTHHYWGVLKTRQHAS